MRRHLVSIVLCLVASVPAACAPDATADLGLNSVRGKVALGTSTQAKGTVAATGSAVVNLPGTPTPTPSVLVTPAPAPTFHPASPPIAISTPNGTPPPLYDTPSPAPT